MRWGKEHYADLSEQYKDMWVAIAGKRASAMGRLWQKLKANLGNWEILLPVG